MARFLHRFRFASPALVALALGLAGASVVMPACASSGSAKSSSGAKKSKAKSNDCKTCERMCEIGAGAKNKPEALEACKADCKKKCK